MGPPTSVLDLVYLGLGPRRFECEAGTVAWVLIIDVRCGISSIVQQLLGIGIPLYNCKPQRADGFVLCVQCPSVRMCARISHGCVGAGLLFLRGSKRKTQHAPDGPWAMSN